MFPIDSNGNLTTKTEGTDNWTYSWNAENQLTKVEKNGAEQARFAYDPLGRRVEKVAGGVTTYHAYDREQILREVRGSAALRSIHGPGIDEPLAQEDGLGVLTYYHADGLGSIVKRTNQTGAVGHEYGYDVWGNAEAGAAEPGYAFTGREWDLETGLYYYRARYYDAHSGRFISEDPVGYFGGDINFYAYVYSSPPNLIDPRGLMGNPPTQAGGCGSGGSDPWIPDAVWSVYDFSGACLIHDKCYDTCATSAFSKLDCDIKFLGNMMGSCRKQASPFCVQAALAYYVGVTAGGGGPYNDAQRKCCKKESSPPPTFTTQWCDPKSGKCFQWMSGYGGGRP